MHTILQRRVSVRFWPAREAIAEVFGYGPGALVGRLLDTLITWQERATQRHALATLDDRILKDVGLGRADVAIEVSKPFWRA